MNEHRRTFRIDKLYHAFLKLKGAPKSSTYRLAETLQAKGFIDLLPGDRYSETDKMTLRQNQNELFRTVQEVIDAVPDES